MDNKRKLRHYLNIYLLWPVYLTALLVFMNIYIYVINVEAGYVTSIFVAIYAIIAVVVYLVRKKSLSEELVRFGVNYGQVQRRLLGELSIPYAVTDAQGCILWADKLFMELVDDEIRTRQLLFSLFGELKPEDYPGSSDTSQALIFHNNRNYRVEFKRIVIENYTEDTYWNSEKRKPTKKDGELIAVYFYDETLITRLQKDIMDQKASIGMLYIDNYDEALSSLEDVRKTLLSALIDRKISKFFQNHDTVHKKIEKDKYIFMVQNQFLEKMKEERFPILDDVRQTGMGNDIAATVSIGIGTNSDTFIRRYYAANSAIDLALGRGGDQVVIKDNDKVEFFGGKSGSVEKNTRVKSRVKAQALRELIEGKDKVLIMGHAMADVDSFGAAVGIYKIASILNKEAHIVLGNELTGTVRVMVDKFADNQEYPNIIIDHAHALELLDPMTLVIVVDVNRPSHTECPELLKRTKSVVVLDHHRQSGEAIENSPLSYIEPSSSSACEIVSEILQYIGDGDSFKLKPLEADAMYAGMMIDTNNFVTKTGVRTFEAAAFLRRSGADITRIRKAFRTEMSEYIAKARAIASSEVFLESFAIAVCNAPEVDSPTILGAQVANELMEINNIKASFVFTEYNNVIYLSARSIDEVNVQVIMEKLGGGGHMSVAGAQFTDCTLEQAMDKLREVLNNMKNGGDL